MATGSNFAWPSVTVKRSSTVLKGRSIVKCNWSDNFATLLEKAGSEFSTEVVIQVIISKNERLDTSHTVPLDAPVKLLETYGCLYVCHYLADNTVWEPAQGVEMPWLYWCRARVGLLYLLFARIHLQALNSFMVTKPFETMLLDTYKSLFLGAWTFPVCLHMLQLLFL